MFDEMDSDGDGTIDLNDFLEVMDENNLGDFLQDHEQGQNLENSSEIET